MTPAVARANVSSRNQTHCRQSSFHPIPTAAGGMTVPPLLTVVDGRVLSAPNLFHPPLQSAVCSLHCSPPYQVTMHCICRRTKSIPPQVQRTAKLRRDFSMPCVRVRATSNLYKGTQAQPGRRGFLQLSVDTASTPCNHGPFSSS